MNLASTIPQVILLIPVLGGLAYYLLAIHSAYRRRLQCRQEASVRDLSSWPPISLFKPLHGADSTLEECLETFFGQDYPVYEILFAVRQSSDPALAVVEKLKQRHPSIPTTIILTGEPPYANAKVYSMEKMAERAKYDLLAITDSDAAVPRDYLRDVARLFEPADVGAITHLYRGVAGEDLWSKLEAIGMTTEFMAGVVVAERMEGMKFALGPSMAIRRECLERIGGFAAMADYLADDFVLGNWADREGYRVALSCLAIDHHATASGFRASFVHRLRWNRSTRRSRPAGYLGQGFTYGSSWALLLAAIFPSPWSLSLLGIVLIARIALAREISRLLQDDQVFSRIWLVPLQDLFSFGSWLGGFVGREIVWRNERYRLLRDGRFEPVHPRK